MTARGAPRNMGAAPSHTAHALTPRFQKPFTSPAPGKSSRFATAPAPAAADHHEDVLKDGEQRC
jgi:hypothetical protein